MFFALRPHHENVIDKPPPDKGFVSGVFDGLLFKFAHESNCVGGCHARTHSCAMNL